MAISAQVGPERKTPQKLSINNTRTWY